MRCFCLAIGLSLLLSGVAESAVQVGGGRVPAPGIDDTAGLPRIGDFFPDLARNSVGLFSRNNLLPLVVGVGATAATHPADGSLHNFFGRADRLGPFESAGDQAGRALIVAGSASGLMALGQIQSDAGFRRFTYDLAQATALTGLITSGLKVTVGRTRPEGNSQVSFPSGHTSSAFAIATVAAEHYGLWGAIPGYLGASLVAVSRLDAEKHYLSDVVAGATLGFIVGRTSVRQADQRYRRLTWAPVLSPRTQTVGLGVTWNLSE